MVPAGPGPRLPWRRDALTVRADVSRLLRGRGFLTSNRGLAAVTALEAGRARRAVTDPAEPWEIPVAKKNRSRIESDLPGRPFTPTRLDDIPERSLAALEPICGRLPLDRLFVLPAATRLVDPVSCVVTPVMVLAFGDEQIGLWVDAGAVGRTLTTPVDRLLAIDDRLILLYGRLRFIAPDGPLVVRYSTVSRGSVGGNVERLRRTMTTRAYAVRPAFVWNAPGAAPPDPWRLPVKWRRLLDQTSVRPDPEAPVAIAVGDVAPARPIPGRPASGMAVLSARELVIANEPVEYRDRARYGVDLLAVPREKLDSLAWDGRLLHVALAASPAPPPVSLPLDPCLVDAMRSAFRDLVRWR
jgi:hypothetical protein